MPEGKKGRWGNNLKEKRGKNKKQTSIWENQVSKAGREGMQEEEQLYYHRNSPVKKKKRARQQRGEDESLTHVQ